MDCIVQDPSDRNGNQASEPEEVVRHSHSPVLMVFTVFAGVAVLVSGVFIGFSAIQVIIGAIGVVVGLWALLTRKHQPE
jgi:hypothetical protein